MCSHTQHINVPHEHLDRGCSPLLSEGRETDVSQTDQKVFLLKQYQEWTDIYNYTLSETAFPIPQTWQGAFRTQL